MQNKLKEAHGALATEVLAYDEEIRYCRSCRYCVLALEETAPNGQIANKFQCYVDPGQEITIDPNRSQCRYYERTEGIGMERVTKAWVEYENIRRDTQSYLSRPQTNLTLYSLYIRF